MKIKVSFFIVFLIAYLLPFKSLAFSWQSVNNRLDYAAQNDFNSQPNKSMYSPKGSYYIGVGCYYNQSSIFDPDFLNNTVWDITFDRKLDLTLQSFYFLRKNVGIGVGLAKREYSTKMSIKNFKTQLNTQELDVDNDYFYPIIEIDELEDIFKIETFEFHTFIKFKLKYFFIDLGVVSSFLNSSTYTINGSATTRGYYEEFDVILSDFPEYGLTRDEFVNQKFSVETQKVNLALYASTGFLIPLNSRILFNLSTSAAYGLSNFQKSFTRHRYDYYRTTELNNRKQNLTTFGVNLAIVIRIN